MLHLGTKKQPAHRNSDGQNPVQNFQSSVSAELIDNAVTLKEQSWVGGVLGGLLESVLNETDVTCIRL